MESLAYMPWKFLREILAQPFPVEELEFRPMGRAKDDAPTTVLAYIDSRSAMSRLTTVFGAGWGTSHETKFMDDRVICHLNLTVEYPGHSQQYLSNIGEKALYYPAKNDQPPKADENACTSAYAQALKRTASMLGVGEYIYSLSRNKPIFGKFKYNKLTNLPEVLSQLPKFMSPIPIDQRIVRLAKLYYLLQHEDVTEVPDADAIAFVKTTFCINPSLPLHAFEKENLEAFLATKLDTHYMKKHFPSVRSDGFRFSSLMTAPAEESELQIKATNGTSSDKSKAKSK